MNNQVKPYSQLPSQKKEQIQTMFDHIAGKYDFLNRFFSLGIDTIWRRYCIKQLKQYKPQIIIDIATGTGDFAIEALTLKPAKIIGVDISTEMLNIARQKIIRKKKEATIEVQYADSEKLPFESHTFDAAICGFGVRNFENLKVGLSETYRVLQTNGIVIILEFSTPRNFPIKYLYRFYFHTVVPFLGRLISQDNSAYNYLPESVAVFPDGEKFMNILKEVGFKSLKLKELSFGIATAYIAQK